MKRILVLCLFVLLTTPAIFAQTKIIAHRGFSGIAPENTLASFQKAIESGADYFELDVHKTKDDSLVIIHDGSVDRTSSNGMTGELWKYDYAELTKVKVGYPEKFGDEFKDEKIPTLREVLSLAKDKIKVSIEIKVYGVEEQVLKIINDLDMRGQVIIFSFHYQVLTKIRTLDKTIPILYLIDYADDTTIEYATLINANAIGVGYATNPSKEYVAKAHNAGLEVWKWTVNEEDQMKQLLEVGLDGIITNYPDKALELRAGK